jgi:hypothetical protein
MIRAADSATHEGEAPLQLGRLYICRYDLERESHRKAWVPVVCASAQLEYTDGYRMSPGTDGIAAGLCGVGYSFTTPLGAECSKICNMAVCETP